jgi:hypothetical protein
VAALQIFNAEKIEKMLAGVFFPHGSARKHKDNYSKADASSRWNFVLFSVVDIPGIHDDAQLIAASTNKHLILSRIRELVKEIKPDQGLSFRVIVTDNDTGEIIDRISFNSPDSLIRLNPN